MLIRYIYNREKEVITMIENILTGTLILMILTALYVAGELIIDVIKNRY
jgi:hypothetical protein